LDFGISKLHDASTTMNVTAEGALVGTPNFMAPEQLRTHIPIDGRVDLYACGVLLYRMICGKLPYVGGTADELYRRILEGRPEPAGTVMDMFLPRRGSGG
jgi:serine/threonine-protein kinase